MLENPLINIPDSSAALQNANTSNKEIKNPFFKFENSEDHFETSETSDLTWVVDSMLML